MATGQSPVAVWRAPYRRTLYEFFQLQQLERFDTLKQRSHLLHLANLVAIGFHEPKRLKDAHREHLAEAGLLPTVASTLEQAAWIVDAVAKVDAMTQADNQADTRADNRTDQQADQRAEGAV